MANDLEKSVWSLGTEQNNELSENIDKYTPLEIVEGFLKNDQDIIPAISQDKENIAKAIELIAEAFRKGGRLIYFGAGTSGRLGVLDASECPPTFGVDPEMVQGIIAGGDVALRNAVEEAEDSKESGIEDVNKLNINENDVVCGITSSGRTPYVLGVVARAKELGATTLGVSCNANTELTQAVDVGIEAVTGPELIQGSTRLKAGTATKMILNILSTGAMIRIGKVYGNRMVDMRPTNEKLRARAIKLTMEITGVDHAEAVKHLEPSAYHVKTAVLTILADVDFATAKQLLENNKGFLREAIAEAEGA